MSEIFVPSTKAKELSEALWALAWPPQVRNGDEATTRLFGQIRDLQGADWLVVETDFGIRVHPEAELNGIADILEPWIAQGYLPAETHSDLAMLVEEKRGERLVVYQAFPKLFQLKSIKNPTGLGRTKAQMIQEKRLSNSILP